MNRHQHQNPPLSPNVAVGGLEAHEAESRIQREKLDHEQTQDLLLSLLELQRTMDPLLATQAYNNHVCPLMSRLPPELLLYILDFLRNDVVTLQCLRIVSRRFLRLLNPQSVIWEGTHYSTRGDPFSLPHDLRLQFRQLLQRDGRCDNCRRWNDTHGRQLFDDCKFQHNQRHTGEIYPALYCYACHTHHDVYQFSSSYPQRLRCLGQQGSVRLCEHVQITWVNIKAHIDNWRQLGERYWQSCLNSFNIECHDASHDTRCTASEAPTWPRARLRTAEYASDIVVLNLEWTPYSRIDGFELKEDGRIPAPRLRALFEQLRNLGPADILYPPCRPGALPEMACFRESFRIGPFLYYKAEPPIASFKTLYDRYGKGENGKKIDIKPHCLRGDGDCRQLLQCLAVRYEKDIMVCKVADMMDTSVKVIPTEHWLHAMDTDTYPHPQASHIRPQCRDETCTNYYRRRKDFMPCSAWPIPKNVSMALSEDHFHVRPPHLQDN